MAHHIDTRLHFDEVREFPDEPAFLRISGVSQTESTLSDRESLGTQEHLVQSDFGQIDFLNVIIDAIGGKDAKFS